MTFPQLYDIYHRHPVVTTDTRNCPAEVFFSRCAVKSSTATPLHSMRWPKVVPMPWWDDTEVAAKDKRCLFVDDVLSTLQELAAHHRRVLDTPVLQITGTNGKTTTKELVAAVLGEKFNVLYTEATSTITSASPSPCSVCVRNMILPSSKPVPITPAKLHS